MLFLGRQQETERTAENVQIQLFWAKKLCPGQGRRAGDGCDRGNAAGSASQGHGEGRGCSAPLAAHPSGQGGARTPLQEFFGMGRLPAPPPACPAPAGRAFTGATGTG